MMLNHSVKEQNKITVSYLPADQFTHSLCTYIYRMPHNWDITPKF